MRTTAGSALVGLLIAGALTAPASAASLSGPATAAPREVVALTAKGLARGQRWGVYLIRPQASGLNCIAPLARRAPARSGRAVFSGKLPATMNCPGIPGAASAQPTPAARTPVTPGRGYRFVVCVPAGGDCRFMPVARTGVQVVRAGAACAAPPRVSSLRAKGVACGTAAAVARGSRAGWTCRRTRDRAARRTVFRCTRAGARVTFARR